MDASVIETVAKYFYLSSLDEQLSFSASQRVLSDLKSNGWLDPKDRRRWVQVLAKWRLRLPSINPRPWSDDHNERAFTFPRDMDMGAWMTFLASVESSEVEAVLLSRILQFSDEEIAAGLGVTVGTVRYRVGRGLRHLGGYLDT